MEKQIACKPVLYLTMLDGNECSWITEISVQNCKATPTLMNNSEANAQRPIKEENSSFGITILIDQDYGMLPQISHKLYVRKLEKDKDYLYFLK